MSFLDLFHLGLAFERALEQVLALVPGVINNIKPGIIITVKGVKVEVGLWVKVDQPSSALSPANPQ